MDPAATSSALVSPANPTPAPFGATASVESVDSSPVAQPPASGGGNSDATGPAAAATDAADATTTEEPGAASAPPDTAAQALPNAPVDDRSANSSGTESGGTALATQAQDPSAKAAAPQLLPADETTVPFEGDQDGISLLATLLGAVTAILASASTLLWWQRRKRTAGPA